MGWLTESRQKKLLLHNPVKDSTLSPQVEGRHHNLRLGHSWNLLLLLWEECRHPTDAQACHGQQPKCPTCPAHQDHEVDEIEQEEFDKFYKLTADDKYGQAAENTERYVGRFFTTDDFKNKMPSNLSIVMGKVDSDDSPLNTPRELLQQHSMLAVTAIASERGGGGGHN
jgi:hypothetical protein